MNGFFSSIGQIRDFQTSGQVFLFYYLFIKSYSGLYSVIAIIIQGVSLMQRYCCHSSGFICMLFCLYQIYTFYFNLILNFSYLSLFAIDTYLCQVKAKHLRHAKQSGIYGCSYQFRIQINKSCGVAKKSGHKKTKTRLKTAVQSFVREPMGSTVTNSYKLGGHFD